MKFVNIEKTEFIEKKNGEKVHISMLPDKIKEQIKIYDQIRQDLLEIEFKKDVYNQARLARQSKISRMVEEYENQNAAENVTEEG